MNSSHYYLKFEDNIRSGIVPRITVELLNFYSGKSLSRKKWVKEKAIVLNYQLDENDGMQKSSRPISYGIISKFIYENNHFSSEAFNLHPYNCFWIDHTLDIQIDFHKFDPGGTNAISLVLPQNQMYGDDYPISLKIDREGHIYSSMQTALVQRIITLRKKLVDQSNNALFSDWLFDLRSLIGDTVSLVDITLHQLYNKAQYDPLPGWNFDKEKVGDKFGRRFKDKLKWIGQITGNPLDNAGDELSSFHNLREIRNHMMHFDPPSLTVPLEEAAIWLNQIVDVAFLLKKIRDKTGVNNSTAILNFMLQKEVVFVPRPPFTARLPLNSKESGYLCSCWPSEDTSSNELGFQNQLATEAENPKDSCAKLSELNRQVVSNTTGTLSTQAAKGFGKKRN